MNDFELNISIAKLLFLECQLCDGQHYKPSVSYWDNGSCVQVDYINNWSDLMPLVVEHRISLELYNLGRCGTYQLDCDGERIDDCMTTVSPQRALAECLLKVLESKRD